MNNQLKSGFNIIVGDKIIATTNDLQEAIDIAYMSMPLRRSINVQV